MKKDYWLLAASALGGAAVWIVVSGVSGRTEAWDAGLYFSLGMPVVCLMSMAFAYFEPSRPWRWGVAPFAGQFAWLLISQGPGNLLPLGIAVFAVLSIPAILLARVAASVAARKEG